LLRYQFANEIVLDLIRHSDLKIQSFVLINEVLSSVAFFSPTVDLCDLVQLLGGHGVGYREGGGVSRRRSRRLYGCGVGAWWCP